MSKKKLLNKIKELWNLESCSSMRFGQLLEIFLIGCQHHENNKCIYYMEDQELKNLIYKIIQEQSKEHVKCVTCGIDIVIKKDSRSHQCKKCLHKEYSKMWEQAGFD